MANFYGMDFMKGFAILVKVEDFMKGFAILVKVDETCNILERQLATGFQSRDESGIG